MENQKPENKLTEAKQHLDQEGSGVKSFVLATLGEGNQIKVHHEGSEDDMHKLVAQISQEMGKAASGEAGSAQHNAQGQAASGLSGLDAGLSSGAHGAHSATSGEFGASTHAHGDEKEADAEEKDGKKDVKKNEGFGKSSGPKVELNDNHSPKKVHNSK